MIIEQQVAMAPTIIAEEGLRQIYLNPELVHDPEWGALMPDDIYEDIRGSYQDVQRHPLFGRAVLHRETKMQKLRQLHQAGAAFIVASDSGSRANPHHNAAAREMHFLVREVGLTPMEAIMAATRWAAVVLNRQNDLGTISEGKLADIIAVDASPLDDIAELLDVAFVMKDGEIYKQ